MLGHWAISLQQAEQLSGSDDGDTEHQMGTDLGVTAHPDVSTTVAVLQARIDALGPASDLEPLGPMRRKRNLFPASRVVVNQRHVSQRPRRGAQHRTAIGRIGQIVEIGQDRLDRNVAIDCVDVQFVAMPIVLKPLAISFSSCVAGRGQFAQSSG